MSFIQQTIKCKHCDSEMNVSTGTFGGGLPAKCPYCGNGLDYEVIADGWHAKENIPTPVTPMTKIREFKECDTCSKKVGMITLCEGCVNNRAVIDHFQQELSSLEGEIGGLAKSGDFTDILNGWQKDMYGGIYNKAIEDVLSVLRQHKEG